MGRAMEVPHVDLAMDCAVGYATTCCDTYDTIHVDTAKCSVQYVLWHGLRQGLRHGPCYGLL